METLSSLLIILVVIIVVLILVWVFGQILVMGARGGGAGSGHKHSGNSGKWNAHLAALDMGQPDYLRSNDDEWKQWEHVCGQPITVDGELVEDNDNRNFENQLGSGR